MLNNLITINFQNYEFTRLQDIRSLMKEHRTIEKENELSDKDDKFIWSYVLKKDNK
jgi:hypothetical protein